MSSLLSMQHRIRKLKDVMDISDSSDTTVAAVADRLVPLYKEYQLERKEILTATIKQALLVITTDHSQSKQPTMTLSLNQSMQNHYNRSGSKRSRPEELEPTEVDEKDNTSENVSTEAGNDAVLAGKVPATKSPSSATKKKKVAFKDGSDASVVNPLLQSSSSGGFQATRPSTRLCDLAGIDSILQQIRELVFYPTQYPELYGHLGVSPPCGILLHGPSGCGKTMLAAAIAGELGLPYFKASGPELVGGTSGESEERIRQIFESAAANAPSVLFIDAIDVIAGKKDASQRGMERRIVAQLFDSIDYISALSNPSHVGSASNPGSNSKNGSNDSISTSTSSAVAESIIGGILGGRSNSKSTVEVDGTPTQSEPTKPKIVVLIAATNKPEVIDPGVRGRFSREVALPVPDAPARSKILQLMTAGMRLDPAVDFRSLGKLTPGFVGADLQCLTREAGMIAVSRIVKSSGLSSGAVAAPNDSGIVECANGKIAEEQEDNNTNTTSAQPNTNTMSADAMVVVVEEKNKPTSSAPLMSENACVQMTDFTLAAKSIQPTAKREGFAVAPDVTWSDVGALAQVREELLHNVLEPISHPERFQHLGLEVPAGVLFFGPPGCGKTLLAKALANQSGANFISVKGPELLSMYVGESESKVRQVFARARASAPCVIFFDELDALCPKRGSGLEGSGGAGGGNGVSDRVVNQLLTELDGLETRRDVYIIAATNRLELIDDAMLRPGRLGKLLYVPLPTDEDRVSILQALTKKVSIQWKSHDHPDGVDLVAVARDKRAEGFSGADLSALVREAGLAVVREMVNATKNRNVSHSGAAMVTSEDIIGRPYTSTTDLAALGASAEAASRDTIVTTATSGDGGRELRSILARHFEAAFTKVRASVAMKDRKRYELVNGYIQEGMGAIQALQLAAKASTKGILSVPE